MDLTQVSEWLGEGAVPGIINSLVMVSLLIFLVAGVYYLIHIGNQYLPKHQRIHIGAEQLKLLIVGVMSFSFLSWIIVHRSQVLSLLAPFILAGIFAYALNPVVLYLISRKLSRLQAVILIFLVVILTITALSMTLFPRLGAEVRHLGDSMPDFSRQWIEKIENWYAQWQLSFPFLPDSMEETASFFNLEMDSLRDWLLSSLGSLLSGLSSLVSSVVNLVMIPVLTFYFMKDSEIITGWIRQSIPTGSRKWIYSLANEVDHVLGGFIRGQLIVALIVGIVSGTSLLLLGIDFAVILGIVAGITNIIPYLGPFIGAFPAILITLLTSPGRTLWVILAFIVIQQIESSVISPRVVGKRVGLHPTLMIFALLAGGALWGLVGLLIAVPAAAVIRIFLGAVFNWFRQRYPAYFENS
mgnify:CR=1 FL=1